jgi:hypothetical protein
LADAGDLLWAFLPGATVSTSWGEDAARRDAEVVTADERAGRALALLALIAGQDV